jgi:hypothetical protein
LKQERGQSNGAPKGYEKQVVSNLKSLKLKGMEQDTEFDIKHEEMAQAHSEDSQQPEEEVKEKPHMNVVFIGHVDPGKTTTQQMLEMKEALFQTFRRIKKAWNY